MSRNFEYPELYSYVIKHFMKFIANNSLKCKPEFYATNKPTPYKLEAYHVLPKVHCCNFVHCPKCYTLHQTNTNKCVYSCSCAQVYMAQFLQYLCTNRKCISSFSYIREVNGHFKMTTRGCNITLKIS